MFVNGLVTGVHSRADNIVATATQYSVGIGASQRIIESHNFPRLSSSFLEFLVIGRIWEEEVLDMRLGMLSL